jgi:hypothetical protein
MFCAAFYVPAIPALAELFIACAGLCYLFCTLLLCCFDFCEHVPKPPVCVLCLLRLRLHTLQGLWGDLLHVSSSLMKESRPATQL